MMISGSWSRGMVSRRIFIAIFILGFSIAVGADLSIEMDMSGIKIRISGIIGYI